MQISFDNTSLITYPFTAKTVAHDSASPRDVNLFNLARQRGSILVNAEYKPKTIKIAGNIKGADVAELEANIDTLKELLSRQGKNLDIEYASGTRRYVATVVNLEISRDFYHLSFVPFTAEFIVPSGIGKDPTLATATISAITTAQYIGTISMVGTTYPKPMITLTFSVASSVSKLEFLANGEKISISHAIIAGDVVVIDCENMQVTINGALVDYTGIFPTFGISANIYDIEITSMSHNYALKIDYYKLYI